jgi:hypothetical protein
MWQNILSIINVVLTCYWRDWACFWFSCTSILGRIFVSARIRAGSRFDRFLCFVLIKMFRVPPKMFSCTAGGYTYPRLKAPVLDSRFTYSSLFSSSLISKIFLLHTSVRSWINPKAIVRLERLDWIEKVQWPHQESNPWPFRYLALSLGYDYRLAFLSRSNHYVVSMTRTFQKYRVRALIGSI